MAIKENHRHVGLDGRVYLPYLHEWRPATHELRELAVWMSSLFGSEPPCYARPTTAGSGGSGNGHGNNQQQQQQQQPPPYAQATTASSSAGHSHTSSHMSGSAYSSVSTSAASAASTTNSNKAAAAAEEERRRKALEQEIADANLAAETARRAAAEEDRLEAEQIRLTRQHEQKLSATQTIATRKVQTEIQTLYQTMKEELRDDLRNQKLLERGKGDIEKLISEGKERQRSLAKGNTELDEAIANLEQWLESIKEQQSAAENKNDATNQQNNSRETKADLMALPADTHSAQMLALSAENAAVDDCIYFLDRALVRGSISLEVFLKEVRKLSKQQFMAKVCCCLLLRAFFICVLEYGVLCVSVVVFLFVSHLKQTLSVCLGV